MPTLFWVAQDGEIEIASVGWVKADFEEMNKKLASVRNIPAAVVFKPSEEVRDFRAG